MLAKVLGLTAVVCVHGYYYDHGWRYSTYPPTTSGSFGSVQPPTSPATSPTEQPSLSRDRTVQPVQPLPRMDGNDDDVDQERRSPSVPMPNIKYFDGYLEMTTGEIRASGHGRVMLAPDYAELVFAIKVRGSDLSKQTVPAPEVPAETDGSEELEEPATVEQPVAPDPPIIPHPPRKIVSAKIVLAEAAKVASRMVEELDRQQKGGKVLDFQTKDFALTEEWKWFEHLKESKMIGYVVSNAISVKVPLLENAPGEAQSHNLNLGQLIDSMIARGANKINSLTFEAELAKKELASLTALDLALQQAKTKGLFTLNKLGLVDEGDEDSVDIVEVDLLETKMVPKMSTVHPMMVRSEVGTPIVPGQIAIDKTVSLKMRYKLGDDDEDDDDE